MTTNEPNPDRADGAALAAALAPALALAIALTMTAGCASAPPERFYTLAAGVRDAATTDAATDAPGADGGGRSIVVAPAALPESVDRPQLVTSAGGNRVAILEQQRWAEPLRTGIARVVAEDLGRLLGTRRVSTREDVLRSPDCRVYLDVRRFDSAASSAAVDVEARWTGTCAGAARRTGRSAAREPAPGGTPDALVVAHGRALDRVSRDIAQAIR